MRLLNCLIQHTRRAQAQAILSDPQKQHDMEAPKILTRGVCYCAICGGPFEPPDFMNKKSNITFGYNPETVSKKQASWITKVRVLLEQIPGDRGGYISGVGKFQDGFIELDPEDDDNRPIPSQINYDCYKTNLTARPLGAIPFHWPCYEILASALYPNTNNPIHHVDLDRLFLTMFLLTENGVSLAIESGAEERQKEH
ncbi:hypothetical protein F4813DRAFT_354520 [Daldinia decipiens]|uniref:uncharacterized protein n=1 Tax=Daldinia decipiens TaxID=326647 RepID=UPI0020C536DD|nr:uncharacterized protein F4813DRAFT_354520 [Daldinia decipiens]KAI1659301.1 hypothetical protein F4813DRAFT_354520 [Daldinia decipiens]